MRCGIIFEYHPIDILYVCAIRVNGKGQHVQDHGIAHSQILAVRENHYVAIDSALHDAIGNIGREALHIYVIVHYAHLDHLAACIAILVNIRHREVFHNYAVGQFHWRAVKGGVSRLPVGIAGPGQVIVIDQAQATALKGVHVTAGTVERNRSVIVEREPRQLDVRIDR